MANEDGVEHEKLLEYLEREITEAQRLESLTPLALIHECLKDNIADDPRVIELMNRVLPGYENIAADGSPIEVDYVSPRLAGADNTAAETEARVWDKCIEVLLAEIKRQAAFGMWPSVDDFKSELETAKVKAIALKT